VSQKLNKKLIRVTTVPMALRYLLPGQMEFMSQNGFDVLMISADGNELDEVIKNEKCRHIIVPMTRKITPVKDLKCLVQLIKIFLKEKPNIVHTHTPKAGLLGMLAAKVCGIKIRIHTVAGLPLMVETGFKYKLLMFIEKLTYSAASNVWPNSNSLMQFIRKHKMCNEKKLRVVSKGSSNGINLDRFNVEVLDREILRAIEVSIDYDPANRYLLFVGRLVADKGIVELVNVFSKISKFYPNTRLILTGDFEENLDPLPAKILQEISQNPAIIHIKWTAKPEYFMALSQYFIFPSHREGLPNVLLQAGAMNLPIICSRIPGNVDIVSDGDTGLIFENKSENSMYEKLVYAFENHAEMTGMAKKLHLEIHSYYKRESFWISMLAAYDQLLEEKM